MNTNIECVHSLSERETACADGMCPLCMADRIRALEAERNAIEVAMIERCAKVALQWQGLGQSSHIADAIRALAKPAPPVT